MFGRHPSLAIARAHSWSLLLTVLAISMFARTGHAVGIDPLWVTNGAVYSIVRDGEIVYLGGDFNLVGPATGGAARLDASTGAVQSFPAVSGSLRAAVSDGSGGWYLGGLFTAVGGTPRTNVAHVLSDGSVAAWNPNANGEVLSLAVSGSLVYAGGSFTSIGGQSRSRIAALDATTGLATAWDPAASGALADVEVVLPVGDTVYACGYFNSIGGQPRNYIAALDATSGLATAWNPNADAPLHAMVRSGSTIYVGGAFTNIGGVPRNGIAALDAATGSATAWNPNANQLVTALALDGSFVYAGGSFTNIGGQARQRIARLDSAGNATAWNPSADGDVKALAVNGTSIYLGGEFSSIGAQPRGNIGAVDASSGLATSWNPNASGGVYVLSPDGASVLAGGYFNTIGAVVRHNIAAIDASSGIVTGWNANATGGPVLALAAQGNTLYAGGDFTSIGFQPRNRIAALDAATGAATSWNPNANATVRVLVPHEGSVLAAGDFTSIGGQTRNRIAALDAGNGTASGWNPNSDNSVRTLVVSGSKVFAGGDFLNVGGQPRNRVAALDLSTGLATGWNPGANGGVRAMVEGFGKIYVGGIFTNIGGQSRAAIAALDTVTGAATSWITSADNGVWALARSGNVLYAGGDFTTIGLPRNRVAALHAVTAATLPWNPGANGVLRALTSSDGVVYAGGAFTTVGGLPQAGIAAVRAVPQVDAIVPASGGNSGKTTVTIHGFDLPQGSFCIIDLVSDIHGTDVEVASDGTSLQATFDLRGGPPGTYNVVVTTPDTQFAFLFNGFTIEQVEAPQLRVDIVGPDSIRASHPTAFDLVISNPGNVDARDVPLWIYGVPTDTSLVLDFTLAAPPQDPGDPDWSSAPLTFAGDAGRYTALVIPCVPPGTTTRRIYLSVPSAFPTFRLGVALTPPWISGNTLGNCLVQGGVIQNPLCAGAQLDAIQAWLAADPSIEALSGIAAWAKIARACEGASSLASALTRSEDILDFMVGPVEGSDPVAPSCVVALPPRWRSELAVAVIFAIDPNDKIGPVGPRPAHAPIPYSIRFENVGTGDAQRVFLADVLSTDLDLSTVSLSTIAFDTTRIHPPPGLRSFATRVDLRPGRNLLVDVRASLDTLTRALTWYFSTLDPATERPPVLAGFLRPNQVSPQGEGSVLFTVRPRPDVGSGTVITNRATIRFDSEAPLTTADWSNAIADTTPPTSRVLPLAASQDSGGFTVRWEATSGGSDLQGFTIYVSENGGPPRVWRTNTIATADTFWARPGSAYRFSSQARDTIGNIEPPHEDADAQTVVNDPAVGVGQPSSLRLGLAGPVPNPARGELWVAFTLPTRRPATLALFDVSGRCVERSEVGALGPGVHRVRLAASRRLRPGLFFVRLIQDGMTLTTRAVYLR